MRVYCYTLCSVSLLCVLHDNPCLQLNTGVYFMARFKRMEKKTLLLLSYFFCILLFPFMDRFTAPSTTDFPWIMGPNVSRISLWTATLKNCLSVLDSVLKEVQTFLIQGFSLSWRRYKPILKKKFPRFMLFKSLSWLIATDFTPSCNRYHQCNRPGISAHIYELQIRIWSQSSLQVNFARYIFVNSC